MSRDNKNGFKADLVNTLVGEESEFKGTIHSQGSIRIEGSLDGELISQGEVYIGEKSKVKADVFGRTVIIAGEVRG